MLDAHTTTSALRVQGYGLEVDRPLKIASQAIEEFVQSMGEPNRSSGANASLIAISIAIAVPNITSAVVGCW